MPTIKIDKQSPHSSQETFQRISKLLGDDKDLRKLDPKYKCDFNATNLSGSAEGSQFKAKMQIAEAGGGAKVELTVELPFHLALVKGMVQKTLEKKLDESLS